MGELARFRPAPGRGIAAPRIPEPPDRLTTGLDVFRAAAAASVARLLREAPGMRLGNDPEAVHASRVAVRRLRSHLRTFRSLLDPEWADAMRRDLAGLGDAIGGVRDAEVLRDRLWAHLDGTGDAGTTDDEAGGALIAALEAARAAARSELLATMASPRYRSLLEALADGATDPPARARRAGRSAERAARLMEAPWRRLERRVSSTGSDPADETLHRIRIDAKRVRYAAEAFVPVLGKPAARFVADARALQSVLGEHQDAVTAMRWLRDHAAHAGDRWVAFAAGRLLAIDERFRDEARAAWPSAWRRLQRRKRFWA